uniref:C2H2-type domain-containing protein n=1 Tax=Mesocestoides corti TaxID=53468 RepID=A0A5K3FKW7_MESCO
MTDTNNSFNPDSSAVFALMKSFSEQHSAMGLPVMEANSSRETEELRHHFLATAMAMLSSPNSQSPTWVCEPPISMPNSKVDLNGNCDEVNMASQLFTGLVNPLSDTSVTPPSEFPFPNPFMMIPPPKNLHPTVNGNKDEDFCELCQKHFCNKYYLRKHKSDVHRIASEPFSQIRKREAGSGESDDNDQSDKSSSTNTIEWMNVLTSSSITSQHLGEGISVRRPSMEAIRILNSGEANPSSEEDQIPVWIPKSESKSSRVELSENATFIPPIIATETGPSPAVNSTVSSKTPNTGTLDIFKSSMAAAKLADRVTCELCKKELCNKYFLRTHKIKVHGLSPQEVGGPIPRSVASKHAEKTQVETAKQNMDLLGLPQPLPPPLSLMTPMLSPQFPAPLGSLPPWLPPHLSSFPQETPRPTQEEPKKDTVLQLMAANALVTCPLCDKTIGPRLFLPTHLTSVHSLSPTDPSFFIFILSARTLENSGESDISTAKLTPSRNSERGSPPSIAFQATNPSLMRLPSTTSVETAIKDQTGVPNISVTHTVNGMLAPPISMNEVSAAGSGFDLATIATTPTTPLLLPPPLGLLSSSPGLYPTPPLPPSQPTSGMMVNTTKWNPVHLAASGLAAKGALSNGSISTTPRKSPNQMRVLCDICNKWICNKYFLRTHKANKHGITDQSAVAASASAGAGLKGPAMAPLDFSKPGKQHQSLEGNAEYGSLGAPGREDVQMIQPPIMTPWSFSKPNPRSPVDRSPHQQNQANGSMNSEDMQESFGSRGCPLNLSLKPSLKTERGLEIKHAVDQFLSNPPDSTSHHKRLKSRRRKLRLQKRAARLLARACKQLSPPQRTSPRRQQVRTHLETTFSRGKACSN